jgi:Ca2+-binding RTX toxin-like protein
VGTCLALVLACLAAGAVRASDTARTDVIRGTGKADRLTGTPRADTIRGLAGDDWLRGLGGNDVLDGGRGRDTLSGGPGNDRILARDASRDRVFCGFGNDRVVADLADQVFRDCETVARPAPPTVPAESRTDCSVTNYRSWTWEQCKPGTKIVRTNEGWHCNRPLVSYGRLPIKVVIVTTAPWRASIAVSVNSGCVGSQGTDVNLIVDVQGKGARSDTASIADAFKTRVNPENLRITGSLQCGRQEEDGHQDALQIQGGTNITFVNVVTGDYEKGLSTCQGAGGGPFYSLNRITNVDFLGGAFINCNHSLSGLHPGTDNDIVDAKFRSGRNDGSDPNCDFHSSKPCTATRALTLRRVTCEQWIGGRWVPVPPVEN